MDQTAHSAPNPGCRRRRHKALKRGGAIAEPRPSSIPSPNRHHYPVKTELKDHRNEGEDLYRGFRSDATQRRRVADPRPRRSSGEKLGAERPSFLPNNAADSFTEAQRRPTTQPKVPGGGGSTKGTAAPILSQLSARYNGDGGGSQPVLGLWFDAGVPKAHDLYPGRAEDPFPAPRPIRAGSL